jgi:hypothetical protein
LYYRIVFIATTKPRKNDALLPELMLPAAVVLLSAFIGRLAARIVP